MNGKDDMTDRKRLPKGNGWFIWVISETMDGDPVEIAKFAKDNGFGHLLFHIHNGYQNELQVLGGADLTPFIQEANKLGIECWAWGAVYGLSWSAGADNVISAFRKYPELVGYIIDAEAGFKGYYAEAVNLMRKLRANLPNIPMGLSSYRYPTLHQTLPWKEFREQCDFDMPQVYWEQDFRDNAGSEQLSNSYADFQRMTPKLPYIPTGTAYKVGSWSSTAKQVEGFINRAKELKCYGINFWVWYQSQKYLPATFETIRKDKVFSVGEIITPDPEPPTNEVVSPELKVLRNVNYRSQPNTNGTVLGYYVAGQTVKVLDIHVNSNISVWVRTDKGWSAVVHGLIKYME
jgi:hypothetical protein